MCDACKASETQESNINGLNLPSAVPLALTGVTGKRNQQKLASEKVKSLQGRGVAGAPLLG